MSNCTCGTSTVNKKRRTKAEISAFDRAIAELVEEVRPATIRQVFYRAEVCGLVPKCEVHGYRRVQQALKRMRENGEIPYGWITDNARIVRGYRRYSGLETYLQEVAMRYRRDYWADADVRVEVWCEKDALAGVLHPTVVEEYGLDLYVTRGFSSITYLQEAAEEIKDDGRQTYVYLLTDFDASGISIADTVSSELRRRVFIYPEEYGEEPQEGLPDGFYPCGVNVEHLAVNRSQIDALGLPTRPAKSSDPRARRFREEHGTDAVELDAIPPQTLRVMVGDAIESHMSRDFLERMKDTEQEERRILEVFPESWREKGG